MGLTGVRDISFVCAPNATVARRASIRIPTRFRRCMFLLSLWVSLRIGLTAANAVRPLARYKYTERPLAAVRLDKNAVGFSERPAQLALLRSPYPPRAATPDGRSYQGTRCATRKCLRSNTHC